MSNPRPVPSGIIDHSPPVLWDSLWKADPDGTLEMPTKALIRQHDVGFWKGTVNDAVLPRETLNVFMRTHPNGLPTDPTRRVYDDAWDYTKHGYFMCGGRLQYRSPAGIFDNATGTDSFF